ncbi:MAG: hypothetical protein IPN01_04410 [Deltaproteobacteria bacterium]|nr:hypothetical protein [Deltaproteobacteria bacterium]
MERVTGDLSGDWIVLGDAAPIAAPLAQAGGNIVTEQTLACRGVIHLRALSGGDAEALLRSDGVGCSGALGPARPAAVCGDPARPGRDAHRPRLSRSDGAVGPAAGLGVRAPRPSGWPD